jgi:hypothetical protein
MAGSGRKTWVANEQLGASEVQTYLQDQVIQTYANAQERDAVLGANVADGMVSYLTDKSYSSDIEVRKNGQWQLEKFSNFDGKNYVLNADFNIWQRGTSFTFTAGSIAEAYTADRWKLSKASGDAVTVSRVAFAANEAPLKAYEGTQYHRTQITTAAANGYVYVTTGIENVKTLASKVLTVSFWAKADSAKSIIVTGENRFGTGATGFDEFQRRAFYMPVNLTNGWARYSYTFTNPVYYNTAVTLGTNNGFTVSFGFSGDISTPAPGATRQTGTFDIWGVQIEESESVTDFELAHHDRTNELLACNRFYYRTTATQTNSIFAKAIARTTTIFDGVVELPTQMKTAPTAIEIAAVGNYGYLCAGVAGVANALVIVAARTNAGQVGLQLTSGTAATALRNAVIRATSTSAFIGVSSEWF